VRIGPDFLHAVVGTSSCFERSNDRARRTT
jgi:hypothetical protein